MTNLDDTTYIPGMCNINKQEVSKRRAIGIIGLVFLVVFTILFVLLDFAIWTRLVLFIPAFIMATGFLQAQNKFCVGFAGAGVQHVGETSVNIEDKKAKRADTLKARTLNLQAVAIAATVTILILFIP
jgi:hypothetical protein